MSPQNLSSAPSVRGRRDLVLAWVSAALMVVLLVTTLIANVDTEYFGPSTILAAGSAVWFGLSARRHGEQAGLLPARIGGVVGGFFLIVITLSLILHFGFGGGE